jgi:hypothetical protein
MKASELSNTIDALVWAKNFMNVKEATNFTIDESLMLAWFANAIMAGFDEGQRRKEARVKRLTEALELMAGNERYAEGEHGHQFVMIARKALEETE